MMSGNSDRENRKKAARIAGILYFVIIVTSLLSMALGPNTLIVNDDDAATLANIADHTFLYRAGILYDLLMYASVVALSVCLYVVLKPFGRNLALLGLLWRLGEAVTGGITVIGNIILVNLIDDGGATIDEMKLIFGMNSAVISVVFVFISLGTIVYSYLFLKSRYIPKILAWFGILAFAIMLLGTVVGIVVPNDATMFLGSPAIIFEIIIGLWLMIRGIDTNDAGTQSG